MVPSFTPSSKCVNFDPPPPISIRGDAEDRNKEKFQRGPLKRRHFRLISRHKTLRCVNSNIVSLLPTLSSGVVEVVVGAAGRGGSDANCCGAAAHHSLSMVCAIERYSDNGNGWWKRKQIGERKYKEDDD